MKKVNGFAVNGQEDHWTVGCPTCYKVHEFTGYFDPDDVTECNCGCKFKTKRIWLNDKEYIQ